MSGAGVGGSLFPSARASARSPPPDPSRPSAGRRRGRRAAAATRGPGTGAAGGSRCLLVSARAPHVCSRWPEKGERDGPEKGSTGCVSRSAPPGTVTQSAAREFPLVGLGIEQLAPGSRWAPMQDATPQIRTHVPSHHTRTHMQPCKPKT